VRIFFWLWVTSHGAWASPPAHQWLKANFHGHARDTLVKDDGAEDAPALHQAVRKAGFDFSVHSTHTSSNIMADVAERFRQQYALEAALDIPGLTAVLGEELSVAPGKNHHTSTRILGSPGPGNIDHLTLFGIHEFVATKTPVAEACDRAHAQGGVCIVNHPGPGPMMWEEGLWEAPQNRDHLDGLEVYNGEAMAVLAFDFEARYLEATAYAQLGLKIAAVSGADTHGPESFKRSRAQLGGISKATKLLSLVLPKSAHERPELDAVTLVDARGRGVADVVEAVRARRTVATWALPLAGLECDGLGEVRKSSEVQLRLRLPREVQQVTLYREGVPVKSWKNVREAVFNEHITLPAAYVFGVRDGGGRLLTSAMWYEPPQP
jgi:hypothetical protein